MVELFAPPLDDARVGKVAKHAFERGTIVVLQPEGARDLARSDLSRLAADKCENVLSGWESWLVAGM